MPAPTDFGPALYSSEFHKLASDIAAAYPTYLPLPSRLLSRGWRVAKFLASSRNQIHHSVYSSQWKDQSILEGECVGIEASIPSPHPELHSEYAKPIYHTV